MGRKKKSEQILEFTPSKYQETIFDFIQHGVGNVVVEACAGSGKTSTLVKAISLIPEDKRILFCAFNKEIVKELQTKVGKRNNVDIKTIHSLGFSILMRNFKGIDVVPHNTKYREFIMNNISYLSKINTYALGRKKFLKYINNICSLIDYSRYNLFDTHKDIEKLIVRHDIDIIGDEIDVVIQALEWGKNNIDRVDYGDMVWLPNVLYLKTYGFDYDYIFVDEAQDLSAVQRELLMKCQRMGTRYAFFGDENQSIYNFAGADIESFRKLKNIPNTISLPLSISYRCAENIVKFAQNYVPTIESNGDGRKGEVVHHGKLEDILDGDMVLCRNNAPLVRLYTDFIKIGRKCFIRGKDIGVNLIHLLESVEEEELNVDLMKPGVFAKLYQSLFEMRNHEIIISGLDEMTVMNSSKLSNRLDMIHTLETLSEDINTKQELIDKIENIFSDKKKEGIALSTIHKAKGLEANNVYIACPTLMPSKSATQDWEKEQEHNLMYVAFTRAKNKLVFLDGSEFDYLLEKTYENIESIERQVNFILGCNTNFKIASFKQALEIVEKSNKIENIIKTNKTVLSSKAKRNNEPKLSSLQNKRLIKRI
jgi:DNA helicase-2/ATP-dependent DNA helicase PcrA